MILSLSRWVYGEFMKTQDFQLFCFIIAALSSVGFYSGSCFLLDNLPSHDEMSSPLIAEKSNSFSVAFKYMGQLCQMRNFSLFIAMSLVQGTFGTFFPNWRFVVFHCHFNSNFMPLFLEVLLQNQLPEYFCPLIMGVSFLLPHLNNFYFLELCSKRGTYSVIKLLLTIKLLTAVIGKLLVFFQVIIQFSVRRRVQDDMVNCNFYRLKPSIHRGDL